jgi:hypothetical protein
MAAATLKLSAISGGSVRNVTNSSANAIACPAQTAETAAGKPGNKTLSIQTKRTPGVCGGREKYPCSCIAGSFESVPLRSSP